MEEYVNLNIKKELTYDELCVTIDVLKTLLVEMIKNRDEYERLFIEDKNRIAKTIN